MKKPLTLFSLCISSYVCAKSPQLQYIKSMYQKSVKLKSRETNNSPDYYLKYLDRNLRQIYARDKKYSEITERTACIDHDILWQSNDFNPKAKLTFTQPNAAKIKVNIGTTTGSKKHAVAYQVQCKPDNNCQITEIFEHGKPFTKKTTKCPNDFYRRYIKKH
ncbi:hypothetical protein [Snodgrassella gandavensis]|uniref:hypothetical protein n=1 Tax=Snodgrassella gandavensis TaxID=2946698 RepID=UPI001EF6D22A|nr:hypothetical protein [Snodgrassella gandavensis]